MMMMMMMMMMSTTLAESVHRQGSVWRLMYYHVSVSVNELVVPDVDPAPNLLTDATTTVLPRWP